MKSSDYRNKFIRVLVVASSLVFSFPAFSEVDIDFSFQTDQWERNGIYEFSVILNNNDSQTVKIAGVQADFTYESADFKEAPILVHDYITGYDFTVNTVNTLTEGYVYYSKGIKVTGSPNYFTVGGSGSRTLVTFRLRVENEAELGVSNFNYLIMVDVVERLDGGGTESVLGTATDAGITIVEDVTPPGTRVIPAGCTLVYGDSTLVVLDEIDTPEYDDLQTVYYEVGEPPVADPGVSSSWTAEGGSIQLPENDSGHPGAITGVLKFFGRDYWGNQEVEFATETYTVDIIKPTLSGLSREPERVKEGDEITVQFTVDEELGESPEVTVNDHQFTPGGSYPNYSYTYVVQASDLEGDRPIRIEVEDEVGNQTVDTSLSIRIDRTAPGFTPVSFLPEALAQNDILTITFDASEELDTDLTEVSIEGNQASYQSNNGLRYVYSYTVLGTEETSFVKVHGYDLVGNDAWNNDDWDLIRATAHDIYNNVGISTETVGVEWKRETYY